MKTIKIKTESATGSITDLEFWRPLAYSEIEPRAGFIGLLGRKLGIKQWGWIERGIRQRFENPSPEELDSLDTDHHYH